MSIRRSLAGLQGEPAGPGFPTPSQWVRTDANATTRTAALASQTLWASPITEFTVSCQVQRITSQFWSGCYGTYRGGAAGDAWLTRWTAATTLELTVFATGGTGTATITVPATTFTVVSRWVAGVATALYVGATSSVQAGGAGQLNVPTSNFFYAGGDAFWSSALNVDQYMSNCCAWFGTALSPAQCQAIANETTDPRSLSPDHAWLFDGDYTDTVGGITLAAYNGLAFEAYAP